MKTFTVSATEKELKELGIQPGASPVSINDLIKSVRYKLAQDALRATQEAAATYGLDAISTEEIEEEIRAVRDAQAGS